MTEKDQYTLIEQSVTPQTANHSIRVGSSFLKNAFNKLGFTVCASDSYYLAAKHMN